MSTYTRDMKGFFKLLVTEYDRGIISAAVKNGSLSTIEQLVLDALLALAED